MMRNVPSCLRVRPTDRPFMPLSNGTRSDMVWLSGHWGGLLCTALTDRKQQHRPHGSFDCPAWPV